MRMSPRKRRAGLITILGLVAAGLGIWARGPRLSLAGRSLEFSIPEGVKRKPLDAMRPDFLAALIASSSLSGQPDVRLRLRAL